MIEIKLYRCDDCSKNYKTYQGLYNHNKRHHDSIKVAPPLTISEEEFNEKGWKFGSFGRPAAGESIPEKKERKILEKVEEITAPIEREKPSYLSDEYTIDDTDIPQPDSIPAIVKLLNIGESLDDENDGEISKAQIKYQGKLARHLYIFLDGVLELFGKGYSGDKDFEILRNKKDYDLLEETTVAMMEEQQISIPYSATTVWGITVGIAYGNPMFRMASKRKKIGRKIIPRFFRRREKPNDENEAN